MEKTHCQARFGYFKHTQHVGGIIRANSLHKLRQWTYCRLVHRAHNKKMLEESKFTKALRQIQIQKKRDAWSNSLTGSKHSTWRLMRQREGKIRKPIVVKNNN